MRETAFQLARNRATIPLITSPAPHNPHLSFLDEHIASRKDWVRYVELKTAMYRSHVAQVQAELAPILDDVFRHAARRSLNPPSVAGRGGS